MGEKECFKCRKEKDLVEFYKHGQMKDGRLNKCKECAKKDVLKHRHDNLEKIREYDRQRGKLPHRVKRNVEYTRIYRKKFPLNHKAHMEVRKALLSGKLVRPKACEVCQEEKRIEAHHEDYNKPLDVIWLCVVCHRGLHLS